MKDKNSESKGLQRECIYERTFISDPGDAVIPAGLSHVEVSG